MINDAIYYILSCISSIICCKLIVHFLAKPFYNYAIRAVKQIDTLLDNHLKDSDKDRILLRNAILLLGQTLGIILGTILIILTSFSITMIYSYQVSGLWFLDSNSFVFWLSVSIGSLILLIPSRKKQTTDYSYWSELFHTIVMDNYYLGMFLFKKDKPKFTYKKEQENNKDFVIVTGLARAGTTALLNLLYDKNYFHSIHYANAPFLLAPNLWKRFYNPKKGIQKERAHGDKILFDVTSIEALEEYFFKVLLKDNYIKKDHLEKQEITSNQLNDYYRYQHLFRQEKADTRYIMKNNNFILRYESLRELNKAFKVLLVFRDPLFHANSLHEQHLNFNKQQKDNPFTLDYMNWLGHHEFGQNQKYFKLNHNPQWEIEYDKFSLNYWISIWIGYYSYVLELKEDENLHLIYYEDLLYKPFELKEKLKKDLNMNLPNFDQEKFEQTETIEHDMNLLDTELVDKAKDIYQKLIERKFKL